MSAPPFLPIGFGHPWLLLALLLLPLLWWLMRATPPSPVRRVFPAVTLLAELSDRDRPAARTPWWLLLLRTLLATLLILAAADPVLDPRPAPADRGPLLVVIDNGWAAAADWQKRLKTVRRLIEADPARPVALLPTAAPRAAAPVFRTPDDLRPHLAALLPEPWPDAPARLAPLIAKLAPSLTFSTLWLSSGVAAEGRDALLAALEARGPVRVIESPAPTLALTPPETERNGTLRLSLVSSRPLPQSGAEEPPRILEIVGRDPAGRTRVLVRRPIASPANARRIPIRLSLPPELLGRIDHFRLAGLASAGAVSLVGGRLGKPRILLVAPRGGEERERLLSPLHYLETALGEIGPVARATLADAAAANPDVIVLADIARIDPATTRRLERWVEKGGRLVRFAGPRMAAATLAPGTTDPLLPVTLRPGDRSLGGVMSWSRPRRLRAFPDASPFQGIPLPDDVTIRRQLLAAPDPELAERTIAMLEDGTPLVTRKPVGRGTVTLFHVAATPDWSSLPLSRLFLDMLGRLATPRGSAISAPVRLSGRMWHPERLVDGFGRLAPARDAAPVPGEALADAPAPGIAPGLYRAGEMRHPVNLFGPDAVLAPASWPADVPVRPLDAPLPRPLAGPLLLLALLLLLVESGAMLLLRGTLHRRRHPPPGTPLLVLALLSLAPAAPGRAQGLAAPPGTAPSVAGEPARSADPLPQAPPPPRLAGEALARALAAASRTTLGYLASGEPAVDRIAEAGLRGLSEALTERTAVEPGPPMRVDPEKDALAPFPLLYWPITASTPMPSPAALARLDRYLATGGMIVFDTRDAPLAAPGADTPARTRLRLIAGALEMPPLAPVPRDHVLTRSFYLIESFPGRFAGGTVWIEAPPTEAEALPGVPFRRLNDGVSPVLIGSNDWIGAWAVNEEGWPLLPVGSGYEGEMQRERALRFGINLVMYVLTGNYKSDQVHVPALLERLGQ